MMVKEWTIKDIVRHIAAEPESALQIDELDDKADGFLHDQGLNPSTQDVANFLNKRPVDGFQETCQSSETVAPPRVHESFDDWQDNTSLILLAPPVHLRTHVMARGTDQFHRRDSRATSFCFFQTTTVLPWHRN